MKLKVTYWHLTVFGLQLKKYSLSKFAKHHLYPIKPQLYPIKTKLYSIIWVDLQLSVDFV